MSKKGIDVSYCQKGLNWSAVKSSGYEFAVIRAGNDLKTRFDTEFEYHVENAKKYKIPFGVYWYGLALDGEQAKTEAAWCLQKIEKYKSDLQLPVYYDLETPDALTKGKASEIAEGFRSVIDAAGYRTGLYCSRGWITKVSKDVVDKFDSIWIADWGDCCRYTGAYDIWQNGRTPKFGGMAVDEDIMVRDIITTDNNTIAREILDHLKTIDTSTDTIRQILKGMI